MTPTKFALRRATAVFVLVIGLGHLAGAQPAGPAADDRTSPAEAARLYEEGKRHFDIGEYALAIVSWKQSYLRSSAPLLLFNIAQAYRLSNNCAQANRFYLNYRRSEKHPKNQAELDKAMARCAGVEPATGDAATSEPPTSAGAPTTDTPPAAPVTGMPPVTPVTGTPPAAITTGTPPAQPPAEPPVTPPVTSPAPTPPGPVASAPTTSQPEPARVPSSNRGGGWRTAGLVTATVGATLLVASGVYAIKAKQDSDTVSGAGAGASYTGAVASADRSGKSAASRAQGLLGLGAVLAVAGGAMWYLGHRQGDAQVDVAIVPGHTEVTFSCVF